MTTPANATVPTPTANNPLRVANPPLTVGDLVRAEPGAVRVLQRHGIDFCCGGGKPLADVCAKANVTVDALLAEVSLQPDDAPDWQAMPIAALTQQIVQRFHEPLEEELPRLVAMADKVLRVHGDKDPERLAALADTVRALRDDLVPHMHKEEVVLFPMLVAGAGQMAQMPIAVMHQEHEAVGELLARIRTLTNDFVPPLAACATWKALYQGLEGLEAETHEHIHIENNVLFPRAFAASVDSTES